jgi:hypothetical protein
LGRPGGPVEQRGAHRPLAGACDERRDHEHEHSREDREPCSQRQHH